jgi:hypothetical protein
MEHLMNFKVKKLPNIQFDIQELIAYYNAVELNFDQLRWIVPTTVDTKTHTVSKMYSWAIQSNLNDPTMPCPPYHIDGIDNVSEQDRFNVPTALIFGFAEKIINAFPTIRQTSIAGHPPGTKIDLHLDNDEFLKIHIPIKTNPDAWFCFEDEQFNLEAGSAYMINTAIPHGTDNLGTTDRIHLIFKFSASDIDTILTTDYTI